MASSLSNLVNNLAERIHKIKSKYEHDNRKCEKCGIKYKDLECCLDLILSNVYAAIKMTKKSVMKFQGRNLLIHTILLITISISLFFCCEKVFTHTNISIVWKNSKKPHYLGKTFTVT